MFALEERERKGEAEEDEERHVQSRGSDYVNR